MEYIALILLGYLFTAIISYGMALYFIQDSSESMKTSRNRKGDAFFASCLGLLGPMGIIIISITLFLCNALHDDMKAKVGLKFIPETRPRDAGSNRQF